MTDRRPLLVVRRGGLGDTLLMTAALRALRRAHSDTALHFAGVREFGAILARYGVVDEVLSSEDLAMWREKASPRLRDYQLVITDGGAFAAIGAPGTRVQGFDPRPCDERPLGLQLAQTLGLAPRWPHDAWLRPPRSRDGALVFAPGSGGRAKCWPAARWLALAAEPSLRQRALRVVAGPAEIERDDPRRWPWPRAPEFVVEVEPVALAARLEAAGVFVGNDSGTTHLAAMLGVPTAALFGPSDARVWAPPGEHVTVVRGHGASMDSIEVDAVGAALDRVQGKRSRTRSQ